MNWKFWEWFKVDKESGEITVSIDDSFNGYEKFPCKSDNCLVRAACTKPCDKLITDRKDLRDFFEKYRCCPDCASESFHEGPCGGLSQNIKCADCGHWFNLALPVFVERIHMSKERFYN